MSDIRLTGDFQLGTNYQQTYFLLHGVSGPLELPGELDCLFRLLFVKPQREVEQERLSVSDQSFFLQIFSAALMRIQKSVCCVHNKITSRKDIS